MPVILDLEPVRLSFHGRWSEDQSQLRINMLEMMAIRSALMKAIKYIHHSCVMISTDNTTMVSYINKQGRTHSPNLCVEVCKVLHLCLEYDQSSPYPSQIQHIGRPSFEIGQASQNRVGFGSTRYRTPSSKCSITLMWICLRHVSISNSHCMYLQSRTIMP